MSTRSGALVLGLYISIGAVIALFASIIFSSLQSPTIEVSDPRRPRSVSRVSRTNAPSYQLQSRTSRDRLELALERTKELLKKRTALLA